MLYRFPKWKDASWNCEFLLQHCRKLYLVDPWYRAGAFWATESPRDSRVDTVINILSVYKAEIESGQVEVIIDYAENFFRAVPDNYFAPIFPKKADIHGCFRPRPSRLRPRACARRGA